MHITIALSGLLLGSCVQMWGMGEERKVYHAKRVADQMRDAPVAQAPGAQAPQAPATAPAPQAQELRQIERSPAQGLITLPAPTRTVLAPGMPGAAPVPGTVMHFMQHNLEDRTVQALGQLVVQEDGQMEDLTPPTPRTASPVLEQLAVQSFALSPAAQDFVAPTLAASRSVSVSAHPTPARSSSSTSSSAFPFVTR